jgi:hypothetical protein
MMLQKIPALILLCAAACTGLRAQETNSAPGGGLAGFRIISERNIFNPNRSTARTARSTSRGGTERKVKVDSFALLGTMSYEKGEFAFFDGSSPEYRKALKPADSIAGYKIADIGANHVRLEANGQAVELRVGMQMKREGEAEWTVSEGPVVSGASSQGAAKTDPESKAPESGDAESEILKRLMQKRQEEK